MKRYNVMRKILFFLSLFSLLISSTSVQAENRAYMPDIDLSIHYSKSFVGGEWGQELAATWSPTKNFNYFYQLGWQTFHNYEVNGSADPQFEDVSQAYIAAGFDIPLSSKIMVQPLLGGTINLIEHYETDTGKGNMGLLAGVNVNYQLADYVSVGIGMKRYYEHDILAGENQFNITLNLDSKPNRQIFKRSYCGNCYYIMVGSYPDKAQAQRDMKRRNLNQHTTFLRRHQTSIEIYIGRFDSYQEAVNFKMRHQITGSVTRMNLFSFW